MAVAGCVMNDYNYQNKHITPDAVVLSGCGLGVLSLILHKKYGEFVGIGWENADCRSATNRLVADRLAGCLHAGGDAADGCQHFAQDGLMFICARFEVA